MRQWVCDVCGEQVKPGWAGAVFIAVKGDAAKPDLCERHVRDLQQLMSLAKDERPANE